ncbi:FAD dependent oxidoreductase [Parvibaculum lavamentivorans DS-1]|uniref:FAD dependent oxidoreductase n=1 Tax=Parvibaculum lavamentivorans (strain DS-1 / DSM 13023 / NCIMB 13966) TaxID=402881 RepID=A7HRN7_PARL1|nr:NAD(P)/FAD-dependent oxidoreductase [Parvibaculum lavamentivorans]ABS62570.1 FAD dependent oxidoreductase [Parvibaculum lavamentivorans DS-1]
MVRHDAIVIGAGLNGLVAAASLARGGLDVLVLDRAAAAGGLSAEYEIVPGFRVPRYTLGSGGLPARIVAGLDLPRHGLRFVRAEGGVSFFPDGAYHAAYRDGVVHRREIARFSRRDADAWTRYRRDMLRAARGLAPLLGGPVRAPVKGFFAGLRARLDLADRIAAIAPEDLADMVRFSTLPLSEFLDSYFESPVVKAHLASAALMRGTLGPSTPTGAFRLVVPWLAETGDAMGGAPETLLPYGGPAALTGALLAVIAAHGGQVRMEAEVTDILMKDRKVRGVVLANGEEIGAGAILSSLDVKRSFLSLFQWRDLPEGLVERVGRVRMKGVTAKVNLALDGLPDFPSLPHGCPSLAGGFRLAGYIPQMERTFSDWRHRIPPRDPLVEVLIPSLHDATLAPAGKQVLSALVQFVPDALHEGAWSGERRDALGDLVIARLAEVSPGIEKLVLAREVLLPNDLEGEIGLTGGDIAYGETTLDQMFMNRPFPGMGSAETPLGNFYLCSPSAHPGPLVPGGAGANAAAHLLERRKGGR